METHSLRTFFYEFKLGHSTADSKKHGYGLWGREHKWTGHSSSDWSVS